MSKHLARKLMLAATLTVLFATAAHASSTTPPPTTTSQPTPDSVTGGDPEPTSPNIIQVILTLLHLA